MKNRITNKFPLILTILGLTVSGCSKSTLSKGEDPTLFTFLVSNGGAPDATQSVCLSNVSLINTCVGATNKGQGLSGAVCSPNSGSAEDSNFGALLSTPYAQGCISTAIQETACNLSANKPLDVTEALEGPFAGLADCIAEQQALNEEITPPQE